MKSIQIRTALFIAPLLVPAIALFAFAQTSPEKGPPTLKIDSTKNGKSVSLQYGSNLEVNLPGNPTTGYSWKLDSIRGKSLKQVGKIDYVADQRDDKRIGSGGTFTARFKAAQRGKSTLTLIYVRPWERGKAPAQTFSTNVEVTK
jgi:inhibitor of cysteine peptidase